jgi:hypothetical protein
MVDPTSIRPVGPPHCLLTRWSSHPPPTPHAGQMQMKNKSKSFITNMMKMLMKTEHKSLEEKN